MPYGAFVAVHGYVFHVTPSSLTETSPGSAKLLLGSPATQKAFSKTTKSGPGPSTMALAPKDTVIEPPRPSDTTLVLPWSGPTPTGGPSTTPGMAGMPKPAQSPGWNSTTPVTKRSARIVPPSGVG